MANYTQDEEGRLLPGKVTCLRARGLLGLGVMLSIFCLLLGCGSDSKQSGSLSAKKEKTAKSSNAPGTVNMMVNNNNGPGKINKEPIARDVEVYPGAGVTAQEAEERVAADRQRTESPTFEALPGVTRGELDARIAANRKRSESPTVEVLPGITRGELDARIAANRKRSESPNYEVLPGITKDQLDARIRAGMK
jgi:hypothetical protein